MTLWILAGVISLAILTILLPRLLTGLFAWPRRYQVADVPPSRVAIVFGAGLWRDGTPSPVLRDRVATAAELYFSGKVEKILMSGSSDFANYSEPRSMRAYGLDLGVPAEAIVMDEAGIRTYDSCYRARHIFKIETAILVTQGFHLPRALYVCNALGLPATGVAADLREYRRFSLLFWSLRETAATLVALWEVHVSPPSMTLGNPQPIFPQEAQ